MAFLVGIGLGVFLGIVVLFPDGLIAMWAHHDKRKESGVNHE